MNIGNQRAIRLFAKYTIVMTVIHFLLETLYTIQFEQHWLGLIPDYIANFLMLMGAFLVFKNVKAVGALCGAWGFSFCLNYRSWAWRLEEFLQGISSVLIDNTMYVLSFTLIISFVSFIISLWFCLPPEIIGKRKE